MVRKRSTTALYREQRLQKCLAYLREFGSLPAARKAANEREMFQANASAWISALARLLKEVDPQPDLTSKEK